MISWVKEVEYYYTVVADKPGEARRLLEFLIEKMVNLLALTAFPLGGGQSQIDLFPEDSGLLKEAAEDAGISLVGPKKALLIQGEDRLGALYDFHLKLSNAGINIYASNGVVDGTGRFGFIVWVDPADYHEASKGCCHLSSERKRDRRARAGSGRYWIGFPWTFCSCRIPMRFPAARRHPKRTNHGMRQSQVWIPGSTRQPRARMQ